MIEQGQYMLHIVADDTGMLKFLVFIFVHDNGHYVYSEKKKIYKFLKW